MNEKGEPEVSNTTVTAISAALPYLETRIIVDYAEQGIDDVVEACLQHEFGNNGAAAIASAIFQLGWDAALKAKS